MFCIATLGPTPACPFYPHSYLINKDCPLFYSIHFVFVHFKTACPILFYKFPLLLKFAALASSYSNYLAIARMIFTMMRNTDPGEDVVITGMSIRCAMSENVEEFKDNLMGGINMVHENPERCDEDYFGVPKAHGFVKNIKKFDATFFGVHPKQAEGMDPHLRILHEVAYESLIDGGMDPAELKNTNTGVFMGTTNSDAREAWTSLDIDEVDGYSLIGTHRAFLANRLSFIFDLRGPSFGIDAACCTSGMAVYQGYNHIKNGQCTAVLVGGVSLVYQPKIAYQISKLGLLCKDSKCKVFDEAADGYVRSEAIVCFLLQKRKDARRVYATLVHSKTNNDGYKEQGVTYPSTESQGQLIREVYEEAGINPEEVEYVEAHGTGTRIGDPQETNGIALAFASSRTKPLLIGAVKSNMGHTEHASGAVGLCKILIAMQTGIIPPNLHYKTPNSRIPALADGRLQVVTEPTKWNATLAGQNCFGFGGQNAHHVLLGNPRVMAEVDKVTEPRLVVYMGRTEQAAQYAMAFVKRFPGNPYVPHLLMQSAFAKPATMPYRGYTILNSQNGKVVVDRVTLGKKPVWWIFGGQGSRLPSMGAELLQLTGFRNSIERCAVMLKPFGLVLPSFLSLTAEEHTDDPIVSSTVATAIQIALVDLLRSMKVPVDGIIGYGAGEIGCAYADGCITLEQAMLIAYHIGSAMKEAKLLSDFSTMDVGLSLDKVKAQVGQYPGTEIVGDNGADSVTLAGPAEQIRMLAESLRSEKVIVSSSNNFGTAVRSSYMEEPLRALRSLLQEVTPVPKARTTRWLSSAFPEADWSTDQAKFASAGYFIHSLRSMVRFRAVLQKIPNNAVTIEISPHGLLQKFIQQTITGSHAFSVSLMNPNSDSALTHLYETIGQLYVKGLDPDVNQLYPAPALPAPRDTPFLGPVVQWDHSSDWRTPHFSDFIHKRSSSAQNSIIVDLLEPLNQHYFQYSFAGQTVFPLGGLMNLLANEFYKQRNCMKVKDQTLQFTDVNFLCDRIPVSRKDATFELSVHFAKSNGYFDVVRGDDVICTGHATLVASSVTEHPLMDNKVSPKILHNEYDELANRGHSYGRHYRVLHKVAVDQGGNCASAVLKGDRDAVIDGLFQLHILSQSQRGVQRVRSIGTLTWDCHRMDALISSASGLPVTIQQGGRVSGPGVELTGLKWIWYEAAIGSSSWMHNPSKHVNGTNEEERSNVMDFQHLPLIVGKIMGIKQFATLDQDLSLGDYGIDSLMAMELELVLERDFGLSLTLQEIRSLCVKDIYSLSNTTNVSDASKIYSKTADDVPLIVDSAHKHYDLGCLVPRKPIVQLCDVPESKQALFFVHPMEGSVLPSLQLLTNHLKFTTYGFNCTAEVSVDSLELLARHYLNEMKKVQPEGPYNLAGYSFGAVVAFEMALQLQNDGNPIGQLILVDGSHALISEFTKSLKTGYSVNPSLSKHDLDSTKHEAFCTSILTLFVTQLIKTQRKQLTEKLDMAKTFDMKVTVAVQELKRCMEFRETAEEDLAEAARLFTRRMIAADAYKPSFKYNGPTTLIKCSEKMVRTIGDDYELRKVCLQEPDIYTVTGNHTEIVLGDTARLTANIINKKLDTVTDETQRNRETGRKVPHYSGSLMHAVTPGRTASASESTMVSVRYN